MGRSHALDAGFRTDGTQITAAGLLTNVIDVGEGSPVLLLHGSGPGVSAASNWSAVIPDLAARHRVIAPDITGFGATELPADGRLDIKVWVRHLIGILDALDLDSAPMVGNSFGGALALAASLRHPERVGAMVLMGTPAGDYPMTPGLRAGREYQPSREAMRALLRHFPFDESVITDELVSERYEASLRHDGQTAIHALLPEPDRDGETIVHGIPERYLADVQSRALILHGREDRVVPFELGLRLHRGIVRSELHAFGQCGHWVQVERRDDFVQLVLDFLAAHGDVA